MKERLTYIDNLKGFLILLVVLGHVIQKMYSPEHFDNNLIFRMIYSFHMALFFMVSGFVTKFAPISIEVLKQRLAKRFMQLVIPFIVWGIVWHFTFNETTLLGFFKSPDCSLWFLWDLFWIVVVYSVSMFLWHIFPKIPGYIWLLISLITLKLGGALLGSAYGVRGIADYYLFYCLGVIIGTYKEKILSRNNIVITGVLLLLFVLMASVWYRVPANIPEDVNQWVVLLNNNGAYRLGTRLVGCFAFLSLFYWTGNKNTKVLSYLGQRTLPIYAIHQTVIWVLAQVFINQAYLFETILGLLISFLVVLGVSLAVMYALQLTRLTSLLFLGIK